MGYTNYHVLADCQYILVFIDKSRKTINSNDNE